MIQIVADTNTFLAVALNEPERAEIVKLTKGCDIIAPEVLPFEIGNALTAMLKRGRLSGSEVSSAWKTVNRIEVGLRKVDVPSALEIAAEHRIYAYDAYFIHCALTLRSPLLSLDRGMLHVARSVGIETLEVNS